jgi:hypothetical protein
MHLATSEPTPPTIGRHVLPWSFVAGLVGGLAFRTVVAVGDWVGGGVSRPAVAAVDPPRFSMSAPASWTPAPPPTISPTKPAVRAQAAEPPAPSAPAPRPETVAWAAVAPGKAAVTAPAPGLERFVLRDPPREEPESFLLPKDPWFALGEVSADDPADAAPQVCAADRTLGTALTWAKSPAEAAGRAGREGKLVFLIHVSGNFEDPGFT